MKKKEHTAKYGRGLWDTTGRFLPSTKANRASTKIGNVLKKTADAIRLHQKQLNNVPV